MPDRAGSVPPTVVEPPAVRRPPRVEAPAAALDAGNRTRSVSPVLDLGPAPERRREWLRVVWAHRAVIYVLARKDFHVRYKRASFGVLWAILVPLLQAAVMVFVFSHIVHVGSRLSYGPYVLSGILAWAYFTATLPTAVTAIVEGSGLTDKVWFPRVILPLIPCLSGLVGLGISMVLLIIAAPILGEPLRPETLLLVPACGLLVLMTIAIALVGSALQVYFRDVRFLVNALIMVWLYATPIMYPQEDVGRLNRIIDINPLTGVVTLFHLAILGQTGSTTSWHWTVGYSVLVTLVLLIVGVEAQRRRDRVFVDLL